MLSRKKFVWLSTLIVLFTSLQAGEAKLDKSVIEKINKETKIFQSPYLNVVEGVDRGDVYFLKVESKSPRGIQRHKTYLDKKSGMIFTGEAYDKDGNLLIYPKESKVVDAGVAFSYGNGKKKLYVVTDPECPYCVKFEQAAKGKLDEYTVHVIFFPLQFHKKVPAMIEWIMQGKDDVAKKERMNAIMLEGSEEYAKLIKDPKKPFVYSKETRAVIDRSMKAVVELEARGTPALYDAELNEVNWVEMLGLNKKR